MEYVIKEQNGKKITTRMVQEKLLLILKEIDRICKKNNIDYFLSDGTCLGAVRHQGFIPWDDDADIGMSREEYKKFIKALEKDLSSDFVFHCYEKNRKYLAPWPAMKIRLKNTYIKEKNTFLQNKCKDSDGIFVDVFIYDHMSKSRIFDFPFRYTNIALFPFITLFENININPVPLKAVFRYNASLYGKICKKSKYYADDITWVYNPLKPYKMLYSDIYPTKTMLFEGMEFPVPNNTNNYLIAKYGKNYMTPPKENKRYGDHIKDINLNGPKKNS